MEGRGLLHHLRPLHFLPLARNCCPYGQRQAEEAASKRPRALASQPACAPVPGEFRAEGLGLGAWGLRFRGSRVSQLAPPPLESDTENNAEHRRKEVKSAEESAPPLRKITDFRVLHPHTLFLCPHSFIYSPPTLPTLRPDPASAPCLPPDARSTSIEGFLLPLASPHILVPLFPEFIADDGHQPGKAHDFRRAHCSIGEHLNMR